MTAVVRMAGMTLRELLRRRAVLGLLLVVPLVFYLGRYEETGQAIRFATLGVGFAVSAAALFSSVGGREIEPLLALSGFRPLQLFLGRLLALLAAGTGVAVVYAVIILVGQDVRSPRAVVAALLITALVAAPLGLLLGAVVPRDMEGALLLISVIGAQMVVDPAKDSAKVLPFWSTREILTYAVDGPGDGSFAAGTTHAVGVTVLLMSATGSVMAFRLRRRRHLRFV
ncbi:hypothetical protein GCM10027160_10430 [Streptomyces calidiresistens]|uniref:ABC transporter permease n=1 Tax=Streptomyces calidiresistens TaxID=1485586 RepID=A0A7W3SZR1_9ACTN|nr:hypothetical protein [Streptomyces calidiresistens]MBB0228226.1 hypothetical protein [Streptomyces calidiresistens]